jgi:hypothetical protein
MYTIENKNYGVKMTFGGFIRKDEMAKWVEDAQGVLETLSNEFGVFVDMRTLDPLPQDSQAEMETGQKLFKQKGMVRSVVILDGPIVTMQFKRIEKNTGIYEWERYIDASANANWQKTGEDWISKGIDPDQ